MGKQWKLTNFIFCGSKITADGDCSHEIKRRLLPGRKAMTNLDSILKSRDIPLPTKVRLVKAICGFASSFQSLSHIRLFVTPGTAAWPVRHQLPDFTQTHVHWVDDAIQPSHPLSSLFPPALNLSQHQGLFKWVSSLHQLAKVLEFWLHHQSFQWIFRTDFL